MHTLEICASNRKHDTDNVIALLEKDPSVEVIEYGCLGNCGRCWLTPFAMINGITVTADNCRELLAVIQQEMKKKEAEASALEELLKKL